MKWTRISALMLFVVVTVSSFGQVTEAEKTLKTQSADTTKGWRKGGVIGLNLSQTSLTNWAAGGQNSFAYNGIFSVFANYKKGKTAWDNSLDLGYGMLKQENPKASIRKILVTGVRSVETAKAIHGMSNAEKGGFEWYLYKYDNKSDKIGFTRVTNEFIMKHLIV